MIKTTKKIRFYENWDHDRSPFKLNQLSVYMRTTTIIIVLSKQLNKHRTFFYVRFSPVEQSQNVTDNFKIIATSTK